jgi:hypothetical protein
MQKTSRAASATPAMILITVIKIALKRVNKGGLAATEPSASAPSVPLRARQIHYTVSQGLTFLNGAATALLDIAYR